VPELLLRAQDVCDVRECVVEIDEDFAFDGNQFVIDGWIREALAVLAYENLRSRVSFCMSCADASTTASCGVSE